MPGQGQGRDAYTDYYSWGSPWRVPKEGPELLIQTTTPEEPKTSLSLTPTPRVSELARSPGTMRTINGGLPKRTHGKERIKERRQERIWCVLRSFKYVFFCVLLMGR